MRVIAWLTLSSAVLCLACSEVPQGGGLERHREGREPRGLQALASGKLSLGALSAERVYHTATLLPSGQVLVTGGLSPYGLLASAEVYDPATGTWSPTGSMSTARVDHTATLLPSGKVLVTGGSGPSGELASAEVYDPAMGTWSPTGSMATARYRHTATRLSSGQVLVAGGSELTGELASVEVYDPETGNWSPTGSLSFPRDRHTATVLPSGQVLVAGGSGWGFGNAEVYDPATGGWSSTGPLVTPRYMHTATLLPSGQVLVAGGWGPGSLASAEVYDPATREWSPAAPIAIGRNSHTATLLPSGQVLITGGSVDSSSSGVLASAEVYDPATRIWSPTGAMAVARSHHTATRLSSGQVLVAGGWGLNGLLAIAEAYDPASGTWSTMGALSLARSRHTATRLPSGKVLVAGGMAGPYGASARAELYEPATGSWSLTGSLSTARSHHTATLLPSGKVLVTGGYGSNGYLDSAEVYDPATGAWSPTGSLVSARAEHTATLLPSGKVLVAGGVGPGSYLDSAEVYDPATGAWSPTGSLATARVEHTATLLSSGRVLVAGGWRPGGVDSAEVYDPATGAWSSTGGMILLRYRHTATRLSSGKVLITGGIAPDGASAEVYDPATGGWSFTGSLSTARSHHTATLLPSGKVLVTGGYGSNGYLDSAEVYDPATGAWSPTGSLVSARAEHTATLLPSGRVLITGGHGLSGVIASVEVVDAARPVVLSPADGSSLNTRQPVYSGTAEPGSTVRVVVDDVAVGTAVATGPGTWSFQQPVALGDGAHTVKAAATDAAGNRSSESRTSTFTVDTVPPSAPVVLSPANGSITPLNRPAYSGTAEPGSTVTVVVDGTAVGTAVAMGPGTWSVQQLVALGDGAHRVSATATDAGGNTSPESSPLTLGVDTVPPSAPVVLSPANGSTSNTNLPVYSGTAEPGSTVTLWEGTTVLGTARADEAGAWSFTSATTLSQGIRLVTATATDTAGHVSPTRNCAFTIDSVAPDAPEVTMPGALINTRVPTVGGNAEAGSTVSVWVDETEAGTAKADATGAWRITLALELSEGAHHATATAADAVGNVSPVSDAHGFTVDTEKPAVPEVRSPGSIVTTPQPTLGGTAEAGSTVTVWLDGQQVGTSRADEEGRWSVTPANELSGGRHGVVAAATDEAGNASAPSAEYAFIIPRSHYGSSCASAPVLPATWAVLALAGALRRRRSGTPVRAIARLAMASVLLALGCAEGPVGQEETPRHEGSESNALLTAARSHWRSTGAMTTARSRHGASFLPSGQVLAAGGYDAAGAPLSSAEVYSPVTRAWSPTGLMATARIEPSVTLLPSGKVLATGGDNPAGILSSAEEYDPDTGSWRSTGSMASGRLAHVATLLPSGKVLVTGGRSSSGTLASAEVYDPATGTWSVTGPMNTARFNHTATLLPSGRVLVTGGEDSNTLASTEVYDPATGTWSNTGSMGTARYDHTATLLASGKVLVVGGRAPSLATAEVYDPATGTWSPTGSLTAARYWHTATLLPSGKVLVAGGDGPSTYLSSAEIYNPGTGEWSTAGSMAVDRDAHTATLLPSGVLLVTGGFGSGGHLANAEEYGQSPVVLSPAHGSTLNIHQPVYSGTAEPGSTVTVRVDGTAVETLVADDSGAWSFQQPEALAEGTHTVQAMATDAEGDTRTESNSHAFTVDVAPLAPVVLSPASGALLSSSRPFYGGTAAPGSTVTVRVDDTVVGTPVADGSGAWSLQQPAVLGDGAHTVKATATDAGGNTSPESSPLTFTVDTVPPLAPVVLSPASDSLTNNNWPAYSGTAEPRSTVTVLEGAFVLGAVKADAVGVWSFIPATALAEGLHSLEATATDEVGNVSASTVHRLTVDTVRPETPEVSQPGAFVNTQRPAMGGTAQAGSSVTVWLDGVMVGTTRADEAGRWSLTPSTPLLEGLHLAEVTATDDAGNVSATQGSAFTIDSVAPDAPEVTAPGALINSRVPGIGGRAEAGSTVSVWVDEIEAGTAKTDATGAWRITLATELAEGAHQATATAADAVGNVSAVSVAYVFTVDTERPAVPEVSSPEALVTTRAPTLGGRAEAGSTVMVWLDGHEVGTDRVDEEGRWSVTPANVLTAGRHGVVATATDEASNTSPPSAEYAFIIPRSHYGWSCASAPMLPATWAVLALALALRRRRPSAP